MEDAINQFWTEQIRATPALRDARVCDKLSPDDRREQVEIMITTTRDNDQSGVIPEYQTEITLRCVYAVTTLQQFSAMWSALTGLIKAPTITTPALRLFSYLHIEDFDAEGEEEVDNDHIYRAANVAVFAKHR